MEWKGICIRYANKNNTIVNNIFFNGGFFLEHYGYSSNNTISDNYIDGKPVIYLEDISNEEINNDFGQVLLLRCENITIKDKNVSNVAVAVELIFSDDCHIINNNFINNHFGLYYYESRLLCSFICGFDSLFCNQDITLF